MQHAELLPTEAVREHDQDQVRGGTVGGRGCRQEGAERGRRELQGGRGSKEVGYCREGLQGGAAGRDCLEGLQEGMQGVGCRGRRVQRLHFCSKLEFIRRAGFMTRTCERTALQERQPKSHTPHSRHVSRLTRLTSHVSRLTSPRARKLKGLIGSVLDSKTDLRRLADVATDAASLVTQLDEYSSDPQLQPILSEYSSDSQLHSCVCLLRAAEWQSDHCGENQVGPPMNGK